MPWNTNNFTNLKDGSRASPPPYLIFETTSSSPGEQPYVAVQGYPALDIALPVVCSFGIAGLILTLTVLCRKSMYTSTNCYLLAMSAADLLVLVLIATRLMDGEFAPRSRAQLFFRIYATYAAIFIQISLMASVWLTVALAVERYIAICRPFQASNGCCAGSLRTARVIIVLVFLLAICSRLATFCEYRVVSFYSTSGAATNNQTTHEATTQNRTTQEGTIHDETSHHDAVRYYYVENTPLAYDSNYTRVYSWIVDGFLTSLLPFCLLFVLNALLIQAIRKSTRYVMRAFSNIGASTNQGGPFVQPDHTRRRRKRWYLRLVRTTSEVQREELQITVMLIGIVVVFFVCQAPYVVYTAVKNIHIAQMNVLPETIVLLRYVTMLLLTAKSSVNFLLYCWFSEKFWTTFKKTFCCRPVDNGSNQVSMTALPVNDHLMVTNRRRSSANTLAVSL